MKQTIEQSIEEQLLGSLDNWKKGKTDFGILSLNQVRQDCGIGFIESYDRNKEIFAAIKKVCKKYGVKYDKKRGCFLQPEEM